MAREDVQLRLLSCLKGERGRPPPRRYLEGEGLRGPNPSPLVDVAVVAVPSIPPPLNSSRAYG